MDDESFEGHRSVTRNSCCPGPFPRASPERAVASSNSIFSYDSKVLGSSRQVVLDMPWEPGLPEAMERGLEKKVKIEAEEEDEGSKSMHHCHGKWDSLKCWKSNASSCSFCGVIYSPLLTSRLALTGLLAVLLIVMTVLTWVFTSTNVQHSVRSVAADFRHELLLRVKDAMEAILQSSNASSVSLAKYLSSLSQVTQVSFVSLEDQVRPALFLVFSVLGRKAQVSFFGKNGFLMSYGADSSGTFFVYANTSYLVPASLNSSTSHVMEVPWKEGEELISSRPWYRWYRQSVDENTGVPIGEPMPIAPFAFWDNECMKSSLHDGQYGATFLAPSAIDSRELLYSFLSSVGQSRSADRFGAVSVGVSLATIGNLFDQFDRQGGAIYLTMADGRLIAQSGVFVHAYDNIIDNATQGLSFAAQSNNTIVAAAAEYLNPHLPAVLALRNDSFTANVDLKGTRYLIDSASVHISEEPLVCVVVIPHESIWRMTERRSHTTLAVLVALATCMGLVGCFFVILLTKGVSNEMRLRAALIQQLEETKSAETKSSHKSLVFANMSHDLRTPLAAILGLIDLCLSDASECSELETNLLQMKSCASNLLGILNTILDMSKIEAGKLSLQESEFDLVTALEEVVDTFSVMGFKKGVEIALDLSDGSVEKVSCVVGDVGRVKQIMANLLSNGVKFTSEGHVILRAWVKPLGISTMRPPFSYKGRFLSWPWNQLLRSPSRNKEICKLILSEQADELNSYIQVEFEVDDTGRGIPKERWKSVFENFVQIESSGPRNYDGTGLGLGIVRSMVRLMGGDISIIDKDEPGEPGTRFRFNLIFKCSKQKSTPGSEEAQRQDILLHDRGSFQATFGVNSTVASSGWRINPTAIPGLFEHSADSRFMSAPAMEDVHVLLAMKGHGGKRIVKKWMEMRGLQVWTVGDWEEFAPTVERIKQEMLLESFHNSGRFESISPESHLYDSWVDDFDTKSLGRVRSSIDTPLHQQPLCGAGSPVHSVPEQRVDGYQTRAHLLIIVDIAMVTQISEALCSDMEDMLLEAGLLSYKIVWLVNPNTPSVDIQFLKSRVRACSLILHKPLYASRLQCIWQLLEELVGNKVQEKGDGEAPLLSPEDCGERVHLDATNSLYTSLSCMNTFREKTSSSGNLFTQSKLKHQSSLPSSTRSLAPLKVEANKEGEVQSRYAPAMEMGRWLPLTPPGQSKPQSSPENKPRKVKRHSKEIPRDSQLLSAMHILVAEDNLILQRLTKTQLVRLGASVECVDNGAEAVRLVLENLYRSKVSPAKRDGVHEGESQGSKKNQHFDLVVMDCEVCISKLNLK